MGSLSIWHWLIVLAVVLVLFGGRGKISQLMGDFGKGVKSFKKGIGGEDDEEVAEEPKTIEQGKDTTIKQSSESESASKS
jgi:sec-independent protein translocase protein TatA